MTAIVYRELTDADVKQFASALHEATSLRLPNSEAPDGSHIVKSLLDEKRWAEVVRIFERVVAHATGR